MVHDSPLVLVIFREPVFVFEICFILVVMRDVQSESEPAYWFVIGETSSGVNRLKLFVVVLITPAIKVTLTKL